MDATITLSPGLAAGSMNFLALLDLLARITGAVAWPIAILVIACWFREPIALTIRRLEHLKGFGVETSFKEGLEEAKEAAVAITPTTTSPQTSVDATHDAFRGQILASFVEIDKSLESLANRLRPQSDRGAGASQQVGRELLPPDELNLYRELRRLRNKAVNDRSFSPTSEAVQAYQELARRLIEAILSIGEGTA